MVKPKVKITDLPKLVRRFERTTLYISEKSSAIAYNTGIYYLQQVADAINNQRFPEKYKELSYFTKALKRARGLADPSAFWVDSGGLLEEVMTTKPQVFKNDHGKKSYVIRFSPETSEKIYHVETEGVTQAGSETRIKRPLFKPLFEQMKDKMMQEGRKVLMDVVKDRERRTGVKW